MDNTIQRKPFYYNLIFVDDYAAFQNMTSVFGSELYDFSGLYTIVMTNASVELFVISKMFEAMWTLGIANTILLNPDLKTSRKVVHIYSYFPYTRGYCGIANPELLHSVFSHHIDVSDANLFRNRFKNFHNCTLTVGTFEIRPFIIVEVTEDENHVKVSGLEADMMSILSERLNFQLSYQFTPNETQWGFLDRTDSTGLLNMIQRGEVDFGVGCISFTKERYRLLKVGTAHYTTKVVFAIPEGRLYTPLEKLLRPFQTKMWIAIAICLCFASIVVMILEISDMKGYFVGSKDDDLMMNLLTIVFGNAILNTSGRSSVRVVLISWIYYCFVIRSVYQGLLFQYLQQEQRWPLVETMADIDREGFMYYMVDAAVRFFEATPHVLNRTIYLPQESDNLNKALENLTRGELHGVILVTSDHIAYHNKHKAECGIATAMKNELVVDPLEAMGRLNLTEKTTSIKGSQFQ
ncbi:ionotropic receptor 21a-like [Armigeres subalbatus]|uniref:ionotropic receptor 21a-like n=1 Tax=Armigeres subalbatus TaxID=124917 RepID=UPI002ED3D540